MLQLDPDRVAVAVVPLDRFHRKRLLGRSAAADGVGRIFRTAYLKAPQILAGALDIHDRSVHQQCADIRLEIIILARIGVFLQITAELQMAVFLEIDRVTVAADVRLSEVGIYDALRPYDPAAAIEVIRFGNQLVLFIPQDLYVPIRENERRNGVLICKVLIGKAA